MTRDATCAERIAEHRAGREETIGVLFRAYDGEPNVTDPDPGWEKDGLGGWRPLSATLDAETAGDRLAELPLGVSVTRLLRVELSTGGPADYVTAEIDGSDVVRAQYHFADWYDHAEIDLEPDSSLWRLAEHYAEQLPEEAER